MALINCSNCGKRFSNKLPKCHQCGTSHSNKTFFSFINIPTLTFNKNPLNKRIEILVFILFVFFCVKLFASSNSSSVNTDLKFEYTAVSGDVWKIIEEGIGFHKSPLNPENELQLKRNLYGFLEPGSLVEIVDAKGVVDRWYNVALLDTDSQSVMATGWIYLGSGRHIKATRIKKSASSPW